MGAGRLQGRVAVVTGGASGIGAGTALRFVEEGARVVVADVQEDAAAAVAAGLGDAAVACRADVTDELDVAGAVDLAVTRFGRLDVMVNNAGILGAVGSIADTTVEAWDATLAVLLRGVFLGMKHAARVMVPQGSGVILSMSSTAGVQGGLGPHAYTAAKHAVIGLTKSVAAELAPHGIRVNAIAPGNTVTAMTAVAITADPAAIDKTAAFIAKASPLGYAGFPVDIANAAVFLASDEARYVNATCLMVDAGQTGAGSTGPNRFHVGEAAVVREAGRRDA